MDRVHCSALLRRGRSASQWNAFLLVELVQFVRSTPPYTIGGLGQHAWNVIVPIYGKVTEYFHRIDHVHILGM